MKAYRVTTPNPGILLGTEDFPTEKLRGQSVLEVLSVREAVSVQGTPLLRLKLKDSTDWPAPGSESVERLLGFFINRHRGNDPHVFKFRDKFWVRAKRSRRKWEQALSFAHHYFPGSKAYAEQRLRQNPRYRGTATWVPYEKWSREGNVVSWLFYEVPTFEA